MQRAGLIMGCVLLALGCTERRSKTPAAPAAGQRSGADAAPKAAADTSPRAAPPADAAAVDAAPPDAAVPTVGRCVGEPGDKPIMAPCADDCECATGFCYAEAFNGGGFCSMDCNAPSIGDCATLRHPDHPQFQKYGCLQLQGQKARHALETTRICVLRCASVDECRGYSKRFDQCGNASGGRMTQWGGSTLGAFGSCIDSSVVDPAKP